MPTRTINLPRPHDKQSAFLDSPAKRICVCAGRRGGKTTGVASKAIQEALAGKRVLETAPTADQTNAFWDAVKLALAEPIAHGDIKKSETSRLLEFPNGGRIRAKTAHDADSLRGDHADVLIFDEFSITDPSAWDEVGAPMLLDNDGDAIFIFTPKRKNHAFKMFVRAQADDTGRWAAFTFSSHDNPHLSKAALDDITGDMTDEAYRQEILAEFLDNEGAVFRNIQNCMNAPLNVVRGDHSNHRMIAGIDWGKQQDYTAISIGCLDCHEEVFRDRFNRVDYTYQEKRLESIHREWKPKRHLAESNAMGEPIIDQLQRSGIPVMGFQTTAQSKPQLIENLSLCLDREEWQFQDDPIWTAELEAYERTVSERTGRSVYNAPKGVHDDTVIARALMVRLANQSAGKKARVRNIL